MVKGRLEGAVRKKGEGGERVKGIARLLHRGYLKGFEGER